MIENTTSNVASSNSTE